MTMAKILARGVGLVALAGAAPATAQYYFGTGSSEVAADRCSAAVDRRIADPDGRVLTVTRVELHRNYARVRGIASSGADYGPYGIGAYGMLGYGYSQPADLTFKCDVAYSGYIRDIDINRR